MSTSGLLPADDHELQNVLISFQYPDGYLEAEAEKRALKEKNSKGPKGPKSKKRALPESNDSTDEEASPLAKKQKSDKAKSGVSSDARKRKGRSKWNLRYVKMSQIPS